MGRPIPPAQAEELLPPLLACLPTSLASPEAPPALTALLSSVLQQRVQLCSSGQQGWLPLLCWDTREAERLVATVQALALEPHPVSGEIELDPVPEAQYRRLDAETVHARFLAAQFRLAATFVWGLDGSGWRLAELRSYEDEMKREATDKGAWGSTAGDVDLDYAERRNDGDHLPTPTLSLSPVLDRDDAGGGGGSDDEDSYWAAYDKTPGRTPGKRSPAKKAGQQSEADYFARYAAEVQPALDPDEPDAAAVREQAGDGNSEASTDAATSPCRPVARLEQQAAAQDRAARGIQQHIGFEIRSLRRLARSAGVELVEFNELVETEMRLLATLEADDQ